MRDLVGLDGERLADMRGNLVLHVADGHFSVAGDPNLAAPYKSPLPGIAA